MSKLPKKYRSGFGEQDPDINSFLAPETTDYYKHEASGVGYNSSKDDDQGFERGALGFTDDDPAFRSPSNTGDFDSVNANHGYLIDNDPSLPSNKLLPGGGPLSQRGGVGAGPPSHRPKNVGHSGQQNRDARGGVDRAGHRGRR